MRKLKLHAQIFSVNCFLILFTTGYGNSQQISSTENKDYTAYNNTKIKNNMENDTLKAYASVNGLKMYYEVQGTGNPVIVLHGGFGNTELFMPNVTELAKNNKVILVDMQGHG